MSAKNKFNFVPRMLLVFCVALAFVAGNARASLDMFLDLGPDIPGESRDSQFSDKVDVLAWSWGMSNSGTTHVGGGSGAGVASCQDLSVTKYVDKASPPLVLACAAGTRLPTVVLTVRTLTSSEAKVVTMKYTLSEVLVTSVSTGASGGESKPTENITLNFAQVKFEYTIINQDGTAGSTSSADVDFTSVPTQ
ncbi:MAG TPA: type VI secretion system tube protein Hcp [Verrucomicrobiae bacterium]|nr:type VI secretion system tube protein Hcp [Verrucomicrobiae bacterium]